jgi:broad specificity phosphatase PhoE
MLLVLIRHGLTAATNGGVLGGWTPGVHLTDPGREQAERLAARLDGVTIPSI